MSETNNKSGFFVGRQHGRVVTRPAKMTWKTRPVGRKGKEAKRNAAVRAVIRDVAGFTPLEKRMMELIRSGIAIKEKKAIKLARKRIGTHRRAMFTRDRLVAAMAAQKKRDAAEKK
jgi:large subunit ribosomal protein L36e